LLINQAQFDKETFVLGKYVADFEQIETRNFTIFQDSIYNVFSTCNGEWGGTIYFQNKKTEEVFEAASTCPIVVNKIGKEYYVTNYMGHLVGLASVLRIPDPSKLQKSKLAFEREQGSQYNDGIQTLLDTVDFYIPTSFVVDGELRHLYSDEKGTYIGEIENGGVVAVHEFDFKFYAHFNQQTNNGNQVLGFSIPDSDYKGVLIIENGKFNFYFFD
jgi:hypothetical protein